MFEQGINWKSGEWLAEKSAQIKALLDNGGNVHLGYKSTYYETPQEGVYKWWHEDCLYLTISTTGEFPVFKEMSFLVAFKAIADILECKDGDVVDKSPDKEHEWADHYIQEHTLELKFW